jgi:hypothetical protein
VRIGRHVTVEPFGFEMETAALHNELGRVEPLH